jgi:ApaG protein
MSGLANISVTTQFIPEQSDSDNQRYVFAYKITIENVSDEVFQLVSRHWMISDSNGDMEEVYGEGVVGEQPFIQPGESFTYTSGAVLKTEVGTMQGRYFLNQGDRKNIPEQIPIFTLSVPRVLH